jgi:uncharacterized protein
LLHIGSRDKLHIRHERLDLGSKLHLLYASDLHLTRWTSHIVEQLHDTCQSCAPDILLLGGDLVDMRSGLPLLSEFITAQICPVWAVGGNHDEQVGLAAVRACVEHSGGRWLAEPVAITPKLHLSGVCQPASHDNTILCAHDPAVFPQAAHAGYRLVLAGHLHGGQCVLARRRGKLYPCAWFFRWGGECFTEHRTTMLVSTGVNDTLPVRWNCPREVILCSC